MDGLIVVDKAPGMTSHDVVARLRRIVGTRRVGHAGTLDPMATGVLVVGVNRATRLLHHLVMTDKAYTATIRFGVTTLTDDAEGEILHTASAAAVSEQAVRDALAELTGDIEQIPATVSAIKVDGRRAYDRVRAGETVILAARSVTVGRLDAIAFRRPTADPIGSEASTGLDAVRVDPVGVGAVLDVDVEVECSSGTYVRSLARDAGAALGVGGHLTALRRTRVGPFTLDQARTLEVLAGMADPVGLPLAVAIAAAMPVRALTSAEAEELSFGRALGAAGIDGTYGALSPAGTAVALLREDGDRARPVLVFRARG